MKERFSLGCIRDEPDRRDWQAQMRLAKEPIPLPPRWDWRVTMTPVKNQGGLGSCVGFACAALKEWQERQQRPWSPLKDASEMWIYWGAKERDPWPGVEGTSIRSALKVLASRGVPTEGGWPYLARAAPGHKPPSKPRWWAAGVARWGKIGAYYRLSTVAQVKEWLVTHGPVVCGVAVGETFFRPEKHQGCPGQSYITLPKTIFGGHAICLVSYDDEWSILGFKNSWGTGWGDSGYGYFSYRYLERLGWDMWGILDY